MIKVYYKKGLQKNLPAAISEGTFYVITDERALYLDVDSDTRIRIGDFQEFATLTDLQANANPSTTALYYVTELNCLAKYDGEKYIQINIDTGATSVEVVGDGNAVTSAAYDPATRILTLTTGATYTTSDDVDGQIDAKIGELKMGGESFDTVKEYIDKKTEGVVTDAVLDILIGDDTGKSVRTIANEELVKQLVPENAQESLDTLAEIAAWSVAPGRRRRHEHGYRRYGNVNRHYARRCRRRYQRGLYQGVRRHSNELGFVLTKAQLNNGQHGRELPAQLFYTRTQDEEGFMSLFKILKGDSSRISMDITPFHDGWCYYTSDDGFYIDSTEEDGGKKRTRINPEGTGGNASRAVKATLAKSGWESERQTLSIVGLRAAQDGVIGVTQDISEA